MLWETESFYDSLVEEPEKVHSLLPMTTEVLIDSIHRIQRVCPNLVPITCTAARQPAATLKAS